MCAGREVDVKQRQFIVDRRRQLYVLVYRTLRAWPLQGVYCLQDFDQVQRCSTRPAVHLMMDRRRGALQRLRSLPSLDNDRLCRTIK